MGSPKTKLSTSILEMKFMKRTKEKVRKQQFQAEGEEYFENELTKRMNKSSERFIIEPSYYFCEKLIDGRISFKGMNPEIEKLMEADEYNKQHEEELKKEKDISDEQMVQHWQNYRKIIKFENKNRKSLEKQNNEHQPMPKRPKFLKPEN